MRPYVIEVIFAFAAGAVIGAWINERRHMEEVNPVVEEPEKKEEKTGVNVKLQDGKLVIAPRKKNRFLLF